MLERLPSPSRPRARPQILDQGFSAGRFAPGHIWRCPEALGVVSAWAGARHAAKHTQDDRHTEDDPNYPAPKVHRAETGKPWSGWIRRGSARTGETPK